MILAAARIEEVPFPLPRLIVASWKFFPTVFGLDGYVDKHPDSKKVESYVWGNRGLITKGFLLYQQERKVFFVSRAGYDMAKRAAAALNLGEPHKQIIRPPNSALLGWLTATAAYQKWMSDEKEFISLRDALTFLIRRNCIDYPVDELRESIDNFFVVVQREDGDQAEKNLIMSLYEYVLRRFKTRLRVMGIHVKG